MTEAEATRFFAEHGQTFSLRPGQILFLPAYWLHRVESHVGDGAGAEEECGAPRRLTIASVETRQ